MNEAITDYCDHQWDSDAPVRVCILCGQIRAFPNGDANPRILWPGRDTKSDPRQLPKFDKFYIIGVAKRYGVKKFAELAGIPSKTLRAWMGTYGRESFQRQLSTGQKPTTKKRGRPPKPDQTPPVIPKITLSKLDLDNCMICGGRVFPTSGYEPHYIQTSRGKIWLCGPCAEGVTKLFEALGIPYELIGVKEHA